MVAPVVGGSAIRSRAPGNPLRNLPGRGESKIVIFDLSPDRSAGSGGSATTLERLLHHRHPPPYGPSKLQGRDGYYNARKRYASHSQQVWHSHPYRRTRH